MTYLDDIRDRKRIDDERREKRDRWEREEREGRKGKSWEDEEAESVCDGQGSDAWIFG